MGLLFVLSIFVGISCRGLHVDAQEMVLIPTASDAYQLSYILDIPSSSVTFQITAETKGFIGFGFSNVSGMISSDIFIGGVNSDGTLYFGDYSSVSVGTPTRDTEQNWELLEGSETETTTYLQFRRVFETTDPADINITDNLMNIIWALGEDDTMGYHGFSRSSLKFNLISGTNEGEDPEPPPTPPTTTIITTTTSRIPTDIPLNSDLIKISYTISEDIITFVAIAKTTGFIGFGFSNNTGMTNSDIFIGGVDDAAGTYFNDYNSRGPGAPSLDAEQDWTFISESETEDETTLTFSRLLITSDFENDVPIEDKDMEIIWALGATDTVQYHGGNRGSTTFNLMQNTDSSTEPSTTQDTTTAAPTDTTIQTTIDTTVDTTIVTTIQTTSTESSTETTTEEVLPGNGEIPLGTDLLKVTYSILREVITFVATSTTKGYIGFGFSNSSGMFPADIFIGGVTASGEVYFGDYKSTDRVVPGRDPQQDWNLIYGLESGDGTTLVFSRLLNTEDLENDVVIEDKLMNIIWALGASDELIHHANRGAVSYNLIAGQAPTPTTETPTTTSTTEAPEQSSTTTEVSPGNGEIPLGTDLLKVTYSILGDNVMFVATAQGIGYVGFGFSNSSGMFPADIFIAGVSDDGETYFGDYKSIATAKPDLDPQQDWVLVFGSESGNETTLVFSRLLNTEDLENDVVIEDKVMNIIWALGSSDEIAYHGSESRGIASYNLIEGQAPSPTPPQSTTQDPNPTTMEPPGNGEIPMGTTLMRVTFTREENNITFTAVAKTLGWVGFGFSNTTGMVDADIFIAGVNGGQPYSKDYISRGLDKPEDDASQDWVLISATESGDSTTIIFSRMLDTGDSLEDIVIEDKAMTIIWAIGPTDTIDQANYHGQNKGWTQYNLIQAPAILPPMEPLEKSIPLSTDLINVTYVIRDDLITFQVIGNTRGFIGFGVNNGTGTAGGMNSSDIFIAWVNDDGSVGFLDTFSIAEEPPINDTDHNWELISGEEAGSQTRLVFSRRLVTGDTEFDIPIEDKYLRVVWALGFEDFVTYHGENNRGKINSFNFIRGTDGSDSSSERIRSWMGFNIFFVLIGIIYL